ncbi:MAG TPA: helix-turn-helix transcriptional regulator [Hymenobacter sp.]|jgi:DNA-binding XRE family transcriptional regulator|uniref:helix-turn-helix transcriptional regulator n=1 Tax=Hymenobacter sp. TaxID=1898978 RepID=UPI002EDAD7C2
MIKHTADNLGSSGPAKSPIRVTKYRDLKDELVGAPGTAEREQFEFELSLELIPLKIKEYRKQQNLTQSELGALIGVQKTQISKLETNAVNVTLDTLLKVFGALHTKIKLSFEPEAAV